MERRDFLKLSALSGTALLFPDALKAKLPSPPPEAEIKRLTAMALQTARSKRAQYADIRIGRNRNQSISTREDRVLTISDSESYGFGIRVLVDGTWGFASSNRVTEREVGNSTLAAIAIAKANKRLQKEPVQLAPPFPQQRSIKNQRSDVLQLIDGVRF